MEAPFEAARASGLIHTGEPLVVLLSGGADSVCLLDCATRLGADVSALHVNYGLRPGADADEQFCKVLCDRMAVPLTVEHVTLGEGNLQAEAREARYALAERLAAERGGDYAAAHTASDQAETVLYRLAVSPGSRALLGMAPRRGRLVRPLLEATREQTREYCQERGLNWRDDPTNEDPRFARSRLRHEVLPVLRALSPAAERTIAETSFLLRDERQVLERVADEALERLAATAAAAIPLEALTAEQPAVARTMLTRLAERATGGTVALSRADAAGILALGREGGTQSLDLGGGLRAVVEYGTLRFAVDGGAAPRVPSPVTLPIPGAIEFGDWEVEARLEKPVGAAGGGFFPRRGDALLSPDALGDRLTVRAWRHGDRMRPAGLDGTKSLQDVFTDQKVPRELRDQLPVVEAEDGIAWVAGVAVGDQFRAAPDETPIVVLAARRRA